MGKKRIAVLCSGGGTNFQTIIDGIKAGEINGEIVLMIASTKTAYAIERAKENGIPVKVISKAKCGSLENAYEKRHEALVECNPDLIVLAGYLGILLPKTIQAFPNKIINTHPALIPSFCGPGMYGHHVHEAVLNYGAKVSGPTIHFVNEQVDGGPIIAQDCVPVLPDDTPDTLQKRVLKLEHVLLPMAVKKFCEDKIRVEGRKVIIDA